MSALGVPCRLLCQDPKTVDMLRKRCQEKGLRIKVVELGSGNWHRVEIREPPDPLELLAAGKEPHPPPVKPPRTTLLEAEAHKRARRARRLERNARRR